MLRRRRYLHLHRRWWWRCRTWTNETRAFAVVATGATHPQLFRTVVDVVVAATGAAATAAAATDDRPVYDEVEDSGVAHHLDRSLEGQIRQALAVAPEDYVAGFQTCGSRWASFSRALFFFIGE